MHEYSKARFSLGYRQHCKQINVRYPPRIGANISVCQCNINYLSDMISTLVKLWSLWFGKSSTKPKLEDSKTLRRRLYLQ